jgi:hypothetical protein
MERYHLEDPGVDGRIILIIYIISYIIIKGSGVFGRELH